MNSNSEFSCIGTLLLLLLRIGCVKPYGVAVRQKAFSPIFFTNATRIASRSGTFFDKFHCFSSISCALMVTDLARIEETYLQEIDLDSPYMRVH